MQHVVFHAVDVVVAVVELGLYHRWLVRREIAPPDEAVRLLQRHGVRVDEVVPPRSCSRLQSRRRGNKVKDFQIQRPSRGSRRQTCGETLERGFEQRWELRNTLVPQADRSVGARHGDVRGSGRICLRSPGQPDLHLRALGTGRDGQELGPGGQRSGGRATAAAAGLEQRTLVVLEVQRERGFRKVVAEADRKRGLVRLANRLQHRGVVGNKVGVPMLSALRDHVQALRAAAHDA
mmetsp:Transcript_21910/g.55232  ORF Transcript_21910/g.55232 Transcript_21910/m.55232 type:complete len:235 (+) Transcript_21910:2191-2895(+)